MDEDRILWKIWMWFLIFLVALGLVWLLSRTTPLGRFLWNQQEYQLNKIDENTKYDSLKEVEDTSRAMIASYNNDKQYWLSYKDSTDKEELSWAKSAKARANATASTFNEYLRKNTYKWAGHIPEDIDHELSLLE